MTSTKASFDKENEPFLQKDGLFNNSVDMEYQPPNMRNSNLRYYVLIVANILLLGCNLAWAAFNLKSRHSLDSHYNIGSELHGSTISPARSSLVYKSEPLHKSHSSPFISENRVDVNEAWSNLLRSSMIRLTKNELTSMNKTSIALKDGSGYIGYMEAIHMLHCVKRMDQYRFKDQYPDLQDTEAFTDGHWNHCLEMLREGIMCNADVTINTYAWKGDDFIKGFRKGSRKCTDWSKIASWLDERALAVDSHESFLQTLVPESQ